MKGQGSDNFHFLYEGVKNFIWHKPIRQQNLLDSVGNYTKMKNEPYTQVFTCRNRTQIYIKRVSQKEHILQRTLSS